MYCDSIELTYHYDFVFCILCFCILYLCILYLCILYFVFCIFVFFFISVLIRSCYMYCDTIEIASLRFCVLYLVLLYLVFFCLVFLYLVFLCLVFLYLVFLYFVFCVSVLIGNNICHMYCNSIETTPVHGIRSQYCHSCCQYWALYEWCNVQCLIKAFSFHGILVSTIGFFSICTYLKRTAQTEPRTARKKTAPWKLKNDRKGNYWCRMPRHY